MVAVTEDLDQGEAQAWSCAHHAFLRTELVVRPWTTRMGAQPGASPPAIDVSCLTREATALLARSPLVGPLELATRGEGLSTWQTVLCPGEAVLAEVAAGGLITLQGPGVITP